MSRKIVSCVGLVMAAQLAALMLRASLQTRFMHAGIQAELAANLSYPAVPALLLLLLWPLIRQNKHELRAWFALPRSWCRTIVLGVALGVLARGIGWCAIIACTAFGVPAYAEPGRGTGLLFDYACPALVVVLLAVVVGSLLIPITEEIINRGLLLHLILPCGKLFAIAGSATFFSILHPPSGMLPAFLIGVAFALLVLRCHVLWPVIVAHASFNLARVFDWYCTRIIWHPESGSAENFLIGILAIACGLSLAVIVAYLVLRANTGAQSAPAARSIS